MMVPFGSNSRRARGSSPQRRAHWVVLACVCASTPALGREKPLDLPSESPSSGEEFAAASRRIESPRDTTKSSERSNALHAWLLSVEAVTHAPVDVGVQAGAETPFGLHVYAGIGWIPPAYAGLLRGIAASATSDPDAHAVLEQASYSGNTWRLQAGIRPFKQVGLYLDGGYSHLTFTGSANLSESGAPNLVAIGGNYSSTTNLDAWFVELGYLGEIKNRLLIGGALGLMRIADSSTTLARTDGVTNPLFGVLSSRADSAFETYGFIPTLTVRLGFDAL